MWRKVQVLTINMESNFDMEILDAENIKEMLSFDRDIVCDLDANNPAMVSFRRDTGIPELAVTGKKDYVYFIHREGRPPKILARCGINLAPPEDDICGYGDDAARLFADGRVASLVGDLVHPSYRGHGLQTEMIRFRLAYLRELEYDYAVAGIVDGNLASRRNYLEMGFKPVGRKTIAWDVQPEQSDDVELLALALAC